VVGLSKVDLQVLVLFIVHVFVVVSTQVAGKVGLREMVEEL
jgi:hypothetical protein